MKFKRRLRQFIGLSLALLTLLAPPPAAKSQGESGISLAAQAGFDGYFKDNHLIPVRVTVENAGPNLEASVQIRLRRQNNAQTVYQHPVSLPTTSRKAFFVYVFPESFFTGSNLGVSLIAEEREVAATQARLNSIRPGDRLYGVLAGNPSAFNLLGDIEPPGGQAFVAQLTPEDLPETSAALVALDVIIVSDVDSSLISPAALQAMRDWVSEGGHLLVSGGVDWQKTAQGFGELLPLSPDGAANIDASQPIQDYTKTPAAINAGLFLSTGSLRPRAEILIGDEDLPIVARSRLGGGMVTYLSVDPSQEPLRSWGGLEGFYRRLLQTPPGEPSWAGGIRNFDLAAQAVATLPDLPAPSAWLFCGFLALYVAALGPANYFLLRKFRRRELAWLSIPGLVIVFSLLAFFIGSRMRGTQPILNRMAVVQAWPETGHARLDGLVGVFSPRRDTYRLELGARILAHPIPSENPVGGGNWIVEQSGDRVAFPQIRTEVGALQAVSVRGAISAPAIAHDLEIRLGQQAATLEGSVTNGSDLSFRDAVIVAQGNVQHLGELLPGETRDIRVANLTVAPQAQEGGDANTDPAPPPGPGPPVFNPGADLLTTEILGTSAYYQDREIYRRYLLLDSLLIGDLTTGGAGDGAYLIAWVEASPIPVELSGVTVQSTELSLYIIALEPNDNHNRN